MIDMIIGLIKTGIGLFTGKQKSDAELQQQNSHEQNEITLEETKRGFTWRSFLGYTLTFIILWNFVVIPVLALFGVLLPPVPLDQVWKVLLVLIGSS
ncbi:hypothetical protein [Kluyvera georgiana]|uniref:hypothetical protein n=1 Tax=Kluyvera georgiana TaxID=73098 RepID=UPI003AF0198B